MAATTSANRLGEWFSEVYSVASEVKSIISATGSATSATATSDTASSTGTNAAGIGSSASATGSSQTTMSTAASSTNSNTVIGTGSSTINGAGSSVTSAASSASSTAAAAAAHHHHSNLLPIILGTVLGALALIALALCIFCCLRRRRRSKKRSKRIASPDEDEVHSWRAHDNPTQPMMAGAAIAGPERYGYPSNPPPMSQHPAYRGLETGSSNPFVPPVPPPRKSAPNARPGLTTDSVPGQQPFTTPSPRQPSPKQPSRADPLAAGVAGLAAGAAAGKVARKPVNRSPHRLETTDLPEAVEPMDGSPGGRYGGYNYGQSPDQANWRSSGAYDPRIDPRHAYGHNRQPSNQPLMSGSGNDSNNPMSYTEDRPPTPFGLMGMGMGGAAAGAAVAHHHDHRQINNSSRDSSDESYDSAMAYPAPSRSPGRHQTPPNVPSRSPRRARFSDPVEMPSPTQSYHHSSTQSGGSNNGAIGRPDYAQPSSYHHQATGSESSRTDSGDSTWRLSSSMPGGWGGHTRESSRTTYPNPSPPTPGGKRMRLSDLRAREEEMERLKDHEGWDEQAAYGKGGHGYNDPDHGVGMAM